MSHTVGSRESSAHKLLQADPPQRNDAPANVPAFV